MRVRNTAGVGIWNFSIGMTTVPGQTPSGTRLHPRTQVHNRSTKDTPTAQQDHFETLLDGSTKHLLTFHQT